MYKDIKEPGVMPGPTAVIYASLIPRFCRSFKFDNAGDYVHSVKDYIFRSSFDEFRIPAYNIKYLRLVAHHDSGR